MHEQSWSIAHFCIGVASRHATSTHIIAWYYCLYYIYWCWPSVVLYGVAYLQYCIGTSTENRQNQYWEYIYRQIQYWENRQHQCILWTGNTMQAYVRKVGGLGGFCVQPKVIRHLMGVDQLRPLPIFCIGVAYQQYCMVLPIYIILLPILYWCCLSTWYYCLYCIGVASLQYCMVLPTYMISLPILYWCCLFTVLHGVAYLHDIIAYIVLVLPLYSITWYMMLLPIYTVLVLPLYSIAWCCLSTVLHGMLTIH